MSKNSKIEWTDHTFNPWEGCQKVGRGCDHCYAETRNARFAGGAAANWGAGAPRRRTSAANWRKPLAWNAAHAEFFAVYGRRQRVFCASLADVFDNAVDREWRDDLANLILDTPNLDWLLLTKRIGNADRMIQEMFLDGAPDNLMLGATIVNQEEANRDIPKLLAMLVARRFLSMEPLLGPVNLGMLVTPNDRVIINSLTGQSGEGFETAGDFERGVDWVIVGGETGAGARPMHPEWVRDLRDQCAATNVSFHFKQWGEWAPGENVTRHHGTVETARWWIDQWTFGRENLASCDGHVDDEPDLYRVGRKAAGRLLDGVQHDGFPEVA